MKWMIALLLFSPPLIAGDYYELPPTPVIGPVQDVTIVEREACQAAALAATEIHHDFATKSLQGGLGIAKDGSCGGAAIGVAKRIDNILWSGKVSTQKGDSKVSAGVNWRF